MTDPETAGDATEAPVAKRRGGSLLGSGAVYALASVAPILATLIVSPLITRLLGPTEYGAAGVSITLYQTGSVLLALGLPFAITRHAIIARSGTSGAVGLVVVGAGIAVVLGLVALLALPLWGPLVLDSEHAPILVWPILSSVGLCLLTLAQSLLRAVHRVYTFVALGCVSAVFGPLFGLLMILVAGASANSYLTGLAAGQALAGVVGLVVVLRQARPSLGGADVAANLRLGLPTLPHSIAISLLVTSLVVLSSQLGGLADAGRLQLALLLGTAPSVLLGAFNNSWAPMIYRADEADRALVLERSTRAVAVLVFMLVGGFVVLAAPVVGFIAGPRLFTDEFLSTSILVTAATPFMALYLANIHLVMLSGRTGPLALTTPASLVLSIALVATLAVALGVEHLQVFALGVCAFQLLQWLMSSLLARRTPFAPPRIGRALPVFLLAALFAIIGSLLLPVWWIALAAFAVLAIGVIVLNRSVLAIRVGI